MDFNVVLVITGGDEHVRYSIPDLRMLGLLGDTLRSLAAPRSLLILRAAWPNPINVALALDSNKTSSFKSADWLMVGLPPGALSQATRREHNLAQDSHVQPAPQWQSSEGIAFRVQELIDDHPDQLVVVVTNRRGAVSYVEALGRIDVAISLTDEPVLAVDSASAQVTVLRPDVTNAWRAVAA